MGEVRVCRLRVLCVHGSLSMFYVLTDHERVQCYMCVHCTCSVTCVYMQRYMCVHAVLHVCTCSATCMYMQYYMCVHAVLHVCTCSATCVYMQCYMCVHAVLHVCTCSATCMYMQCYMFVHAMLHVCTCSVTYVQLQKLHQNGNDCNWYFFEGEDCMLSVLMNVLYTLLTTNTCVSLSTKSPLWFQI